MSKRPEGTTVDTRPWWFEASWEWGDNDMLMPAAMDIRVERGEGADVGHLDLVFTPSVEMKALLAEFADSVLDYVLANPEHYGLQRQEKTATD